MTVTAGTQRTNLMHITDWMPTFEHIASSLPATGYSGFDQFDAITTGTNAPRDVSFTLLKYNSSNFRNFFHHGRSATAAAKLHTIMENFVMQILLGLRLLERGKEVIYKIYLAS